MVHLWSGNDSARTSKCEATRRSPRSGTQGSGDAQGLRVNACSAVVAPRSGATMTRPIQVDEVYIRCVRKLSKASMSWSTFTGFVR
jgi:hypothetical protein